MAWALAYVVVLPAVMDAAMFLMVELVDCALAVATRYFSKELGTPSDGVDPPIKLCQDFTVTKLGNLLWLIWNATTQEYLYISDW